MSAKQTQRRLRTLLWGCSLVVATVGTGCQSHIGGQILPSPYYHEDDVQYFAPGSEFPLAEEAAAMQADKADERDRNF